MNNVLSFTRGAHAFQQIQPLICGKDLKHVFKTHRSPFYRSDISSVLIHPTSRSMLLIEMGFNFGVINWSSNRFSMFYFIEQLNKCLKSILILEILFSQYNTDKTILENNSVQDMYNILHDDNKDCITRISTQFVNAFKWHITLGVIPVMILLPKMANIQPNPWNIKTYFAMLENNQSCKILDLDKFDEIIISVHDRKSFICTDYKNHPISLLSFEKILMTSTFGFTSFLGCIIEFELEYIHGHKIKNENAIINQTRTVLVVASQNNINNDTENKHVTKTHGSEQQMKKNNDVLEEVSLKDEDIANDEDYKQIMNEICVLQKNIRSQKNGVVIPGNPEPIPSASQYIAPIHRYGALSDSITDQHDISARILEYEKLKDRVIKAEMESILFKKKATFLERDLQDILRRYNDLINRYNTIDLLIRAMKEKEKQNKTQGEQIIKHNENLQNQLKKSNTVIQQLLDQCQMQEEEKSKFMHLFLNTSFNAEELINNTTREELINSFIGTLKVSNIQKGVREVTIDQLLLQNKIIPQPIFLHIKSQHNLMILNSWLPAEWMEDKPINICQHGKEDTTIQSTKNIIESTPLFQIIDANPIGQNQICSASPISKRFMAIQHPQDINLKEMSEMLKNKWTENNKIFFALKDDLYTIHGQKFPPVLTETSISKFILPFLTELFYPGFILKYYDVSINLILSYYYEKHTIPSIFETMTLFYSKYMETNVLE